MCIIATFLNYFYFNILTLSPLAFVNYSKKEHKKTIKIKKSNFFKP